MLQDITNQQTWNNLVLRQGSNFMQSWEWGNFREANGISIHRVVAKNKQDKTAKQGLAIQIEKRPLGLGKNYLYIAGLDYKTPLINHQLLKSLKNIASKEGAVFLKIEPLQEASKQQINHLVKLGFIRAKNIQPKDTLILEITKPEEELFQGFHRKHRYNIRLAIKKGIQVKTVKTSQEFEQFYELLKKTDQRKHTKSFPKKYYKELFLLSQKTESKPPQVSLKIKFLLAWLGPQPIAGIVVIFWNYRATYLIGASNYQYRQYMAPHLLQWEAIKLAKKLGAKEYDFWGIAKKEAFSSEKEFERHHWAGITRFKQGFGGKIVSYPSAYAYVFSPFWHKIYKISKRLKF